MAHENARVGRQIENAADRAIEGARVAAGEIGTRRAVIGHEQRVADEGAGRPRVPRTIYVMQAGRVAGRVPGRDLEAADREALAVGKELVELRAVAGERRLQIEIPFQVAWTALMPAPMPMRPPSFA